jgi:ABC-type sugar transport system, permease component
VPVRESRQVLQKGLVITMNKVRKIKKRKTKSEWLFDIAIYVFFFLFTIVCIFPFYYIFINTISDNNLVTTGKISIFPKGIHFQNYISVLKLDTIGPAAFVSLARTVLGTLFAIVAASFPAYAFTRQEFWHRKFWYRYVVATMYFSAGVIPTFLTYKSIHIYNTFWVYILPAVVTPFNLILCKTYIESLPQSLEESAEIDGAGYLVRYLKLILPLSKPILATVAIFSAVGQWNNFMDTVLYIQNKALFTLQYVLYQYLNQANALAEIMRNDPSVMANNDLSTILTPLTIQYTICMVTILPILMVYPLFQRYFVKGIMIGAVKG